jgi:hypothetical protein
MSIKGERLYQEKELSYRIINLHINEIISLKKELLINVSCVLLEYFL